MLFELGKLYNYMKYENNIYIAFQKKKKKISDHFFKINCKV